MDALAGRSAIVTGGATGLGRAFAEALAGQGADVTFCDLLAETPAVAADIEAAAKAQADSGQSGRVQGIVADVSKLDDLKRLVDGAGSAFGGVDLLVNNAGRWRRTPVTDSDQFIKSSKNSHQQNGWTLLHKAKVSSPNLYPGLFTTLMSFV